MSTAFLQALQAKRTIPQQTETKPKPKPIPVVAPIQPKPIAIPGVNVTAKPTLTVERVINRKRIDLFFSSKPDDDVLGSLHGNGWRYRPSDKAWYNKDDECTRHYLKMKFNIELEEARSVEMPVEFKPDEHHKELKPTPVVGDSNPKFEQFKSKVNRLIEYFKIEPADLMLLAIDALFEKHESELN